MENFAQAVEKIITEQEKIIGPIALEQAKKVDGLSINWEKHEIGFSGDKKHIINELVSKYESLFGKASIEVCKDAIKNLHIPHDQLPNILQ